MAYAKHCARKDFSDLAQRYCSLARSCLSLQAVRAWVAHYERHKDCDYDAEQNAGYASALSREKQPQAERYRKTKCACPPSISPQSSDRTSNDCAFDCYAAD
jgi:hypothetical protein